MGQFRVGQNLGGVFGHLRYVSDGRGISGYPVLHHFADSAGLRGDHGNPRSHRLQGRKSKTFHLRRKQKQVGVYQDFLHLGHLAYKNGILFQAQGADLVFRRFPLGAVAHHN